MGFSMSEIFQYKWKGYFNYQKEEGMWNTCDSKNWSVTNEWEGKAVSGVEFLEYFTKTNAKRKEIEDNIVGQGMKFDKTVSGDEYYDWWSGLHPSLPVNRSLAICLKHFTDTNNKISNYEILSYIIRNNMMVRIRSLDKEESYWWFYLHSGDYDIVSEALTEFILALPQLFFKDKKFNKLQEDESEIKKTSQLLKSNRTLAKLRVKFLNKNHDKIEFEHSAQISHYHKGLICGCIPIPSKVRNKKNGTEPSIVKTDEIVFKSPNVTKILKYLSYVWQDKFAKSVLISAPPGSGKELFSNSIPYGTGRVKPDEKVNTLSLGSGEKEYLEKLLYGEGENPEGLIKNSKYGVLFLDEVHHPETEDGIRASLLRPLESDDFIPVKSDKPEKVEDVLFVLATSKPLKGRNKGEKGLADIPPPDFWTRMTHVVTIKHPFEGIWGNDINDIIESYFKFFWWERVEKYFEIDPETQIDQKKVKYKFVKSNNTLEYHQRLHQMNILLEDNDKDEFLPKLASDFREKFLYILSEKRIQPHEVSVRGFRNIVTRLFSICSSNITQGIELEPDNLKREMDPIIHEILEIATLAPK